MSKLTLPAGRRDHVRGPKDAPVTLVEYGDFECPFCGEAYGILKEVAARMGTRLRFVFRNFPLITLHPHAESAARASESAGGQGKFWEMHDLLFENQHALEDENLVEYAHALGLDVRQFVEDMRSGRFLPKIKEDFMSGVRSGANGTPTFFINGIRHEGSYERSEMIQALEHAAAAKASR